MDLSEEIDQAMDVLNESMDSVFYTYDTYFRDFEEFQKGSAGEELAEPMKFLVPTLLTM